MDATMQTTAKLLALTVEHAKSRDRAPEGLVAAMLRSLMAWGHAEIAEEFLQEAVAQGLATALPPRLQGLVRAGDAAQFQRDLAPAQQEQAVRVLADVLVASGAEGLAADLCLNVPTPQGGLSVWVSEQKGRLHTVAKDYAKAVEAFEAGRPIARMGERERSAYLRALRETKDYLRLQSRLEEYVTSVKPSDVPPAIAAAFCRMSSARGRWDALVKFLRHDPLVGPETGAWGVAKSVESLVRTGQSERVSGFLSKRKHLLEPVTEYRKGCEWVRFLFDPRQHGTSLNVPDPTVRLSDPGCVLWKFGTKGCLIWFESPHMMALGIVIEELLPVLEKAGISLLVISDTSGFAATNGFGSTLNDPAESARRLGETVAQHGFDWTVTAGMSGGGMAAGYYGVKNGALGAFCLAGRTYFPTVEELNTVTENPFFPLAHERYSTVLDTVVTNILPDLEQAPEFDYENHFGTGSIYDQLYIRHIQHLPNVRIVMDDHDSHDPIPHLMENGLLLPKLEAFLDRVRPD